MMMIHQGNQNQNENVFTATQWEELEQQALIYKYIVSGVPVPSDLILSVRTSLYNSSSISSSLSANQPTLGGGFPYNYHHQVIGGYGRKIDLEPGRCRRTDGKKWRCSKEAFPDSKYCERHMHRGRNRSRKPVEISKSIPHSEFIMPQTLKDYTRRDLDQRSYFQLNNTTTQMHHFNFQNLKKKEEEETHCFVMGTDLSEEAATSKQPFHHFFSNPNTDTNYQVMIDPPDLFQSKPRPYW